MTRRLSPAADSRSSVPPVRIILGTLTLLAAVTACSAEIDSEPSPSQTSSAESVPEQELQFEVIDSQETGLGTEVTVAVDANRNLRPIFEQVLADEDAATVTIVCASTPSSREGYLLYGSEAEGIVGVSMQRCAVETPG